MWDRVCKSSSGDEQPTGTRLRARRSLSQWFAIALALALASGTVLVAPASGAEQPGDRDIDAVVAVYQDFLRREPTPVELEHLAPYLGVLMTENDVRVEVLGSRAFWRRSGRSISAYIHGLHHQLYDRRARSAEMRALREMFRTHLGNRATARRVLAAEVLAASGYDPDGFGARRIVVDKTESGRIQRISLRLSRPVGEEPTTMEAYIEGSPVVGQTVVRRDGNVVSLVPDDRVFMTGSLVATATTGEEPRARADAADRILPIMQPLFPDVRVVAYYGNHQTRLLGVLGETGPIAAAARVKAAAAPFSEPGRPAVGAFEMIATVAQGSAGADGNYSAPSKIEDLKRWIDVAADEGLYVILDIQPGRSDFYTESIRYEELLREPHVGLALDPEWRMGPYQRPGQTVGSVTAAEVNRVSEWLSELGIENALPEKMFIVHQFQTRMIKNREDLIHRDGLATIIHADGFGGRAIKLDTYGHIQVAHPLWNGFKLFIDEDYRMFQPAEVLAFQGVPVPDLITYQ
ncbi:MAG: hypothetical protein ACR2P0_03060 [Acidimicrobiales bacterium]